MNRSGKQTKPVFLKLHKIDEDGRECIPVNKQAGRGWKNQC
jgi:hypothetical protein